MEQVRIKEWKREKSKKLFELWLNGIMFYRTMREWKRWKIKRESVRCSLQVATDLNKEISEWKR